MTNYAAYQNTAVDDAGNVIPLAYIEVRSETTGNLATIYSSRTGAALANPFRADSEGFFRFHAAGDSYKVRVYTGSSGAPTTEKIHRYVPVGTAAEYDYDDIVAAATPGVELEDFGGGTGIADNSAAWSAALAYCATSGDRLITLRAGSYAFTSKPAVITRGITIRGLSRSASKLVRNYTGSGATEGFIEFDGSSGEFSGGLIEVQVLAANGTTGGAGIKLTGLTTISRASFNAFYDVIVSGTGTGTWSYPIYCNGSAITTAGSQGLRDLAFINVQVFNATVASVYMNNVTNTKWIGDIFTGAGSISKFVITGGSGGTTEQSQGVQISGNLVGSLDATYCSKIKFFGECDTYTRDSTATDCVVIGTFGGTAGSAGTREVLLDTNYGFDLYNPIYARKGIVSHPTTNVAAFQNQIGVFGGTTAGDGYLAGNAYYDPAGFTWRTINTYGAGVVGYSILETSLNGGLKHAGSSAATTAGGAITPTFVDVVKQGDTISVAAGSVSAAGLYFGGDVDTGLYSPSAGNLVVTLNNFAAAQFSATQFIQSRSGGSPNITGQRTDIHGSGASVATFVFRGMDANGNSTAYAQVNGTAVDDTDGSEDGSLLLQALVNGTNTSIAVAGNTSGTPHFRPNANDGTQLGTATLSWADLFLASGAVINFANGDVTITHSSNQVDFAGASTGYMFDAKFGYGAGSGSTVTQATSKSTGVTLSKPTGQITMNNAALAADTTVSFTLTNTVIAATDILLLNHISGGTAGAYLINAQAAAGSATINVRNITPGSLSEAIVISFAVIKGVTS